MGIKFKNFFKSIFNKENILYTLIVVIGCAVIITNRAIAGFKNILWIADFGSIFGIIYIVCKAKHNIFEFILNICSTIFLGVTSIMQHLWLTGAICVIVSIPCQIMGIVNWIRNKKNDKTKNLQKLSKKVLLILCGVCLALTAGFAGLLWYLDGTLFYLDAIYSATFLIGIILASRCYIDQFYFFIPCNTLGVVMYGILCAQNINNLPLALLNLVFTITIILGYFNWRKLIKKQNEEIKAKEIENSKTN